MSEKKLNNWIVKLLNSFTLGVTIGIFISMLVNFIIKTPYFSIPTMSLVDKFGSNLATLINIIFYGIIGVVSYFSSMIFDKENWSLLKCTIVHFLLVQILILIIGILLGWLDSYFSFVLPISVLIYAIIWISITLYIKNKINKFNNKIN